MPEMRMQSYEEEYRLLLTGEDEPPAGPEPAASSGTDSGTDSGSGSAAAAESQADAEPALLRA